METQEREIELIDYIEIILKRKWHILAGTLICVAATSGYLFLKAPDVPLYQASALIFIVPSQAQAQLKETQVELPTLTPAFYQAVAMADENILAMNQLQRALIDSFGLVLPQTPLSLEAEVMDNVRMVMRVSAADTLLARRVLYAWVEIFLDQNQELNAAESKRYYNDIVSQYDQARDKLEQVDSALAAMTTSSVLGAVQHQQELYQKKLIDIQDTLLVAEFELKEKEDRLARLREMMQGMDVEGQPIYMLSAAEHTSLKARQMSPLARQMLDYIVALDTLEKVQGIAEAEYNLALLEFDRENNYAQLSREVEEVAKVVEGYKKSYLEARSQQMTASVTLQAIENERAKHPEVLGDGGSVNGAEFRELNPVRIELEKQRAKEGISFETARVYAERGQAELQELQVRLEVTQRSLSEVQKERQALADRLARELFSIKVQVNFFEKAFDEARRLYLDQKKELNTSEIEAAELRLRTQDQKQMLRELEVTIKELQGNMAAELTERERLNREKKIFLATFERFSQLSEEARIAQQKAAKATTNLRLITRDVMARPAGSAVSSQKIPTSAALGLLLSTVLVFLIEYIRKARQRRSAGQLRRSGDI